MPDLEHSVRIAADEKVVRALVSTGDGLSQWWAEDVRSVPGVESVVELGFFDRATVYRLRKQLDAGDSVVWQCESGAEWEGTSLEFRLESAAGATNLHFAHRRWAEPTPYFVSCNTSWGGLMFRLRAAAEGQAPGPLFERSSLAY